LQARCTICKEVIATEDGVFSVSVVRMPAAIRRRLAV
jgi:hypothetical protein